MRIPIEGPTAQKKLRIRSGRDEKQKRAPSEEESGQNPSKNPSPQLTDLATCEAYSSSGFALKWGLYCTCTWADSDSAGFELCFF